MQTPAKWCTMWKLLSAIAAASLIVVGCGGGGVGSSSATPAPTVQRSPSSVAVAASPTVASGPTETPVAVGTPTPGAAAPSPVPTHAPGATPTPVSGHPTASAPPPTQAPPPPAAQTLSIVAKDTKFSVTSSSVTAGTVVTIKLDNQDAGVQHDIVVFDPGGVQVAATDVATGPVMQQTSFTPAAPGRYTFKCTVHPQQMYGVITVQ
jgi:plastocyanin